MVRFISLSIIPLLLVLLSIQILNTSCTHETANLDQYDTICFTDQILPIIQNSCGTTGCHDGFGGVEGFSAANYQTIMRAVKPGDPKGSALYNAITNIWGENFMPPDNPLPIADRNLIQLWIAQGALPTTCVVDTNSNGGIIPTPNPDTLCFEQNILPIFLSSCATSGCHDASSHVEGYNLSNYTSIMNSEEGIVPYSPGSSKIYNVVTGGEEDDRMPPAPRAPLTSQQISDLQQWILEGALNSNCPRNGCDTLQEISFSNQVFPVVQNYCLSCHNTSIANGGVMLNNYSNVKATAEVIRNNTSLLVGVIRNQDGFKAMPPGYQLDECSIRIIELWIGQGLQNN